MYLYQELLRMLYRVLDVLAQKPALLSIVLLYYLAHYLVKDGGA